MVDSVHGHYEDLVDPNPRSSKKRIDDFSKLKVVVLGGLVMDVSIRTPRLPDWGKAVQAESLTLRPGGKGLNQAIAASRLGAQVTAIGAVGNDELGERILAELGEHGVDHTTVDVIKDATSPVTVVFNRDSGETSFVGWKNAARVRIDADTVRRHSAVLREADVLLCTLEVPPGAVAAALEIAASGNAMTVLNPAPPLQKPGRHVADLTLHRVDVLIPNEWEARELAGRHGEPGYSVREVAAFLGDEKAGANAVCITRAHEGCAFLRAGEYREYPAYETETRDGTGASDAFCVALALHLRGGNQAEEAIRQAQVAGAWAVSKPGKNMPTREQLHDHRLRLDAARETTSRSE